MSAISYRFGPFRLDPEERFLYCREQPVSLTPRAIDTLLVLVERHGRLVSKEDLLRDVWRDAFVEENNLAQHISMLRRTLAQGGGEAPFIETVPKRGYRFVAAVVEDAHRAGPSLPSPDSGQVETVPSQVPQDPTVAPARPRRWAWGTAAAVPVLVSVMWLVSSSQQPEGGPQGSTSTPAAGVTNGNATPRVAVLPFLNLGTEAEEYLAAGTTEEISSRLAMLSRLGVVSSTSTREYDRRGKTIRRIGADFGAAYVIEGSVGGHAGAGGRVRIIPKLIRVADDVTVWTHQYDAPPADLVAVYADVAHQITDALRVVVESDERHSVSARPTTDTEAYLSYLRGIATFQQSWSDTSLQALARRDLEDAVARDPRFALAWSWLAHVYATQYATGAQRTPAVRDATYRAARSALDLAPELPEAHAGMARALILDRDYDGALARLETARRDRPNSAEFLRQAAYVQQLRGQWTAARDLHMLAFELDPASAADLLAIHYLHLRQYGEARKYIAVANAANRSAAIVPGAWLQFSETGEVGPSRELLERALPLRSPADARVRGLLARLEWFDGRHERALALIRDMDGAGAWWAANFRFPAAIAMGQVYESRGQRDRAAQRYAAAMTELEARARTNPDDFQIEAAMGLAAAGLGRAAEAVRHGTRAVELLPVTKDAAGGPVYLYALAAIHARSGQHADAFATLDRMFSVPGFYSEKWIERDPWFASLRSHPKFREYVERWSRQKGPALFDGGASKTSGPRRN